MGLHFGDFCDFLPLKSRGPRKDVKYKHDTLI